MAEQRRLACQVVLPDNSTQRWGPDEPDARRIVESASLGTEMPGGFGPATLTLGRTSSYDPLPPMYSYVRTYDAASNETLHEGRIVGVPQGSTTTIDVALEGYAKALEDDNTARVIFYDRDLSSWQGPSLQRQYNLINSSFGPGDASVTWDPTILAPALEVGIDNAPWSAGGLPVIEGFYNGQGLPLAFIDYAWKKAASVNNADTHWSWQVFLATDDLQTTTDASGELRAAGPGSGTVTATAGNRLYAQVQFLFSIPGGTENVHYSVGFTLLGVVGDHALTLQGSVATPNTGRGLLVSDMLAYAVASWAPSLTYTTGTGGSIEPTSFVVPHAVFKDFTTASAIIQALVLYGGNASYPLDWGVYDNRTFFAKTPGTYGRVWRIRRDQAAEDPSDGPDVASMLNGVVVTYDDGTGTTKSVGPPASGADVTDSLLADTTANNPANNDGQRHWSVYAAGVTSQAGALLIGQLILANANRMPWRGSVTVKGEATETGGQVHSAGLIRAGDRVVVEDDPDTRERFINSTSFDGQTASCSIGAQPDRLETLLAKAGVVLVGRL